VPTVADIDPRGLYAPYDVVRAIPPSRSGRPVSYRALARWRKDGRLHATRDARGVWLYHGWSIIAFCGATDLLKRPPQPTAKQRADARAAVARGLARYGIELPRQQGGGK
jgi:hypothetical protein